MAFISNYGAISVGATAILIMAANNERKGCVIFNNGANTIYLGMDSSVTSSTGLPLLANATFSNSNLQALWRGAIYAITVSSTSDTRFWEWGL